MNNDEKKMICGTHGTVDYGLMCCHLMEVVKSESHSPVKYYAADNNDGDDEATDKECLWCENCEKVLISEGGWSDRASAYAAPEVLCEFCIDTFKKENVNDCL